MVLSSIVPRISSCAARILARRLPCRRELQEQTHHPLDGVREGRQYEDHGTHQGGKQQRGAIREGERVGLRQHRREDHDQQRHDAGGIGDARWSDKNHGEAGRQPTRRDVDKRIAQQHGADQLLRIAQELLTSFARAFPSCSNACMRARECAVRAVSLPFEDGGKHQHQNDGANRQKDLNFHFRSTGPNAPP